MKRLILAVLLVILLSVAVSAVMPPRYKECMQRGYNVTDDYCVFPDGSNCTLKAFNNGSCGEEFMTEDYCVEAGDPVWEEGMCCEGSEKYLPEGAVGQPHCKRIEEKGEQNSASPNYLYYSIPVILLIAGIFFYWLKKK